MSKNEILQELVRLPSADRQEILDRLLELEEWDVLRLDEPSAEEKALLDEVLQAYADQPGGGRPWQEVLAEIRTRKVS